MSNDDELIVIADRLIEKNIEQLKYYIRDLGIKRSTVKASPGSGLVDALNFGVDISKSELIARMDSDDLMKPMRLFLQKRFLDENRKIGLIGGALELVSQEGALESVKIYPTDPIELRKSMHEGCYMAHPTTMYRKAIFQEVGGYRELYPYAEDYDLWMRIMNLSDIANLDAILISYRQHPGQISNAVRKIQQESTNRIKVAFAK